jgi:hypothetical protein
MFVVVMRSDTDHATRYHFVCLALIGEVSIAIKAQSFIESRTQRS